MIPIKLQIQHIHKAFKNHVTALEDISFSISQGEFVSVIGPSGAGKGTVCAAVRNSEDVSIEYSISATTRNPRDGEVHGREYFFYDKETFEQLREQGGFLEWAQVYDNYYGTPRQYVEEVLERGNDCILEIDPQGAFQVRAAWPEADRKSVV